MSAGIIGAHVLLYSDNPEADRAFFRDILNFPAVDAGGGWLIFALPPAEAGIHPSDGEKRQPHGGRRLLGSVLYLMCDNLPALMSPSWPKALVAPPSKPKSGESKRRFNCPAAAKLVSINPRTRRPLA